MKKILFAFPVAAAAMLLLQFSGVMFSCNTCPYVIKNRSRTYEVCKYAQGNGIGVVILNSNEAKRSEDDSYEDMKTYAKEQGYN